MRFRYVPGLVVLLITAFSGCKKEKELYVPEADIYIEKVTPAITSATVPAGFSGMDITERGMCYGETANPDTNGPHVKSGSGQGNASLVLTSLKGGTTYYLRAYAINRSGTGYSEVRSLATKQAPDLQLSAVVMRGTNSATMTVGTNYYAVSGTSTVGVCYSLEQNPDIGDNVSYVGADQFLSYTRHLTGLAAGQTYYARGFMNLSGEVFYSNEITFQTYFGTVTDIEGNRYYTVKIGSQEWMAQSLRVTKFRDDTAIPYLFSSSWSTYGGAGQGEYGNLNFNGGYYGRLYNTRAAQNPELAPDGWHIPTRDEWETLINAVGGANPGAQLCAPAPDWPLSGSTNRLGFSALPGGYRDMWGYDYGRDNSVMFWTSTDDGSEIQALYLDHNSYLWQGTDRNFQQGMYVRCVKD